MSFKVLYKDPYFVAIDKPAGFHVHPPEDQRHKIPRSVNCLYILNQQLQTYIYPVHRLDRATSGVLLFALDSDAARLGCDLFKNKDIKKIYYCVVRGRLEKPGCIDYPLASPAPGQDAERQPAITEYAPLASIELPFASGRHSTSRYTLLRVKPLTGKMHQIRRHFAHLSHPLVGDTVYGDGKHNRYFREQLNISGLLLKSYSLEFIHPMNGSGLYIASTWNGMWHKVFDLFQVCPFERRYRKNLPSLGS
jgi:tRNA pseudouridine65 synthase